eukprot:scaffold654_cov207-Ochromonas_danica.AAC.48
MASQALSICNMISRVLEATEKEGFTLDHFLWDDDSSMIDFVDLASNDEMTLESSQTISLGSDTIISSMRVGSEDQKIEKMKIKINREPTHDKSQRQGNYNDWNIESVVD